MLRVKYDYCQPEIHLQIKATHCYNNLEIVNNKRNWYIISWKYELGFEYIFLFIKGFFFLRVIFFSFCQVLNKALRLKPLVLFLSTHEICMNICYCKTTQHKEQRWLKLVLTRACSESSQSELTHGHLKDLCTI